VVSKRATRPYVSRPSRSWLPASQSDTNTGIRAEPHNAWARDIVRTHHSHRAVVTTYFSQKFACRCGTARRAREADPQSMPGRRFWLGRCR